MKLLNYNKFDRALLIGNDCLAPARPNPEDLSQ